MITRYWENSESLLETEYYNSTKASHECWLVGIHCRRVYVHKGTQVQLRVTANCRIWSASWLPGENWSWVSIEVLSGGWENNTTSLEWDQVPLNNLKHNDKGGSQIHHPIVQNRTKKGAQGWGRRWLAYNRTLQDTYLRHSALFYCQSSFFKSFQFFLLLLFIQTAQLEARGNAIVLKSLWFKSA